MLSDFNETGIFRAEFRKILKYQISWKSVQWEASPSMRTGGQTDITRLIVTSRNFTSTPKKQGQWQKWLIKCYIPRDSCQICGAFNLLNEGKGICITQERNLVNSRWKLKLLNDATSVIVPKDAKMVPVLLQ